MPRNPGWELLKVGERAGRGGGEPCELHRILSAVVFDVRMNFVFSIFKLIFSGQKLRFSKMITLLDLCVSSLRRGQANLLCIVPILTDDPRRESKEKKHIYDKTTTAQHRTTKPTTTMPNNKSFE
jgi:hypothetical protein